jgi:hypothetical protein
MNIASHSLAVEHVIFVTRNGQTENYREHHRVEYYSSMILIDLLDQ